MRDGMMWTFQHSFDKSNLAKYFHHTSNVHIRIVLPKQQKVTFYFKYIEFYVGHMLILVFKWHIIYPIQEESFHLEQLIKDEVFKIFWYFIHSFIISYRIARN